MSIADLSPEVNSAILQARALASMGVPIFRCRLDSEGNPSGAFDWQISEPGDDSYHAIDMWRPGMGLGAVMGHVFDVVDIDPRNGGLDSWPMLLARLADDPPEVFGIAATPSRGAHFWIASQGVTRCKLLKGIDLQAASGFVFIAPTIRPSKDPADSGEPRPYTWVSPIHWNVSPWMQEPSQAFTELPWDLTAGDGSTHGRNGRRSPEDLMRAVLAAETGEQRGAILRLVWEYRVRNIPEEGIADTLRNFLPRVPVFEPGNPWYPARGGNPDKWIRNLMKQSKSWSPDATDEEMEGMADASPNFIRPEDPEETEFWESRPILRHIYDWSRARMASPLAVLSEAMAGAICRTPPSFQLPPLTGGNGTLNMLVALVGKSGAGKNAASETAEAAFKWDGVMGLIDKDVPRIPLGSGEGLARSFGFNQRDKESGRTELVRTFLSILVTIPEIDTFAAINARGGATISQELRKLYSGETLGFGWADIQKRVIIPKHTYRACVIAGVQPGRGEAILGDIDGGLAQRWLWLPATDPSAPDGEFTDPPIIEWEPPGLIPELAYSDGPHIMKVFAGAAAEMKAARLRELRGHADEMESHALYTRLKVAAGLALLDGCDEVRESDWELSAFVMAVSKRTREQVQQHLARKAHEATKQAGRTDATRQQAKDDTLQVNTNTRLAKKVLSILDDYEWTGYNAISKNGMSPADKEILRGVLNGLVGIGKVESREYQNRGRTGTQYRKIKTG